MKIIFMGTPVFAVESLERIIKDGNEVAAVFTRADKPKGRGHHLAPTPVKEAALKHNIPVFQPLTLKDPETVAKIKEINPDCIVVVAYGRLLPESVLNIPKLGCINVHASLLPRWRGAAPIQWSVIEGDKKTGVTTMYMAKGLDTGDMILKTEVLIGENETSGELHDRLMKAGAETLSKTLKLLAQGKAPREKQTDENTCYASMIDKNTALINWESEPQKIHNLVRGMAPKPGAHTFLNGGIFKIYETKLLPQVSFKNSAPGTVVSADDEGLTVACKGGAAILVKTVQAQGGKKMTAAAYANGHGLNIGTVFESEQK